MADVQNFDFLIIGSGEAGKNGERPWSNAN